MRACLARTHTARAPRPRVAGFCAALDDPTTDLDNFHSLEICQAGAVEPLVGLLAHKHEGVQGAATGALTSLAENPSCQRMIAAAGAIEPLVRMATYGGDYSKLGALNALEARRRRPPPPPAPTRMLSLRRCSS